MVINSFKKNVQIIDQLKNEAFLKNFEDIMTQIIKKNEKMAVLVESVAIGSFVFSGLWV